MNSTRPVNKLIPFKQDCVQFVGWVKRTFREFCVAVMCEPVGFRQILYIYGSCIYTVIRNRVNSTAEFVSLNMKDRNYTHVKAGASLSLFSPLSFCWPCCATEIIQIWRGEIMYSQWLDIFQGTRKDRFATFSILFRKQFWKRQNKIFKNWYLHSYY